MFQVMLAGILVMLGTWQRYPVPRDGGNTPAPTVQAGNSTDSSSRPSRSWAFVENRGQWDPSTRFRAVAPDQIVHVRSDGLLLQLLTKPSSERRVQGANVRLTFEGQREQARLSSRNRLPGLRNYFLGNDPSKWATRVSAFERVRWERLYAGIDVGLRSDPGHLEYDLELEPGADLGQVVISVEGAERLALDGQGSLLVHTPIGILRQSRPRSWYVGPEGERQPVDVHFRLLDESRYGFDLEGPPRPLALVVDPPIIWSTFLGGRWGGSVWESINDMEVLPNGDVLVVGETDASNFPTTPGAFDRTVEGLDAFVTRTSADGSSLVFSTVLGGIAGHSTSDSAAGLAVASDGSIIIAGRTGSTDFPVTPGALDTTLEGIDAFVTRLAPAGDQLIYSTYLGGSSLDDAFDVDVDPADRAVVVGRTISFDFPVSANAFDPTFNDVTGPFDGDGFVTYLSPNGDFVHYSSFLGGDGSDGAEAVVVDLAGTAVITGSAFSPDFPIRGLAFDSTHNGAFDAFLARVEPGLGTNALVLSTFYGGDNADQGRSIALGPDGSIVIAGQTASTDFPTTTNAYDRTFNGGLEDLFIVRFSGSGEVRLGATLIGGSGREETRGGLVVDSSNSPIFTGYTTSADFPTTPGSFASAYLGNYVDRVIIRLTPAFDRLLYSSYLLGGDSGEYVLGLDVDPVGVATIAGRVGTNGGFPVTEGAWDTTFNGPIWDGFITRLALGPVLLFNGQPSGGSSVHFVLENAFPGEYGNEAQVLLSCSGTSGIPLPGGLELPLTFDFCTAWSLAVAPALRATIDNAGTAKTPTITFPSNIPVGLTIHAAAVTWDPTIPRLVSVTCPLSVTAE